MRDSMKFIYYYWGMAQITVYDVFIPGGMPKITYVPRDHLGIEGKVERWQRGAHTTLLVVSGPTKTGKTVLLKRFFPDATWISGGVIDTVENFWETICDELEVYTGHALTVDASRKQSKSVEGGANGGVLYGSGGTENAVEGGRGVTRHRTGSPASAARKALREEKPVLIIDDFHYVRQDEQLKIIRGLKDLIFEGLPVVVLAVPHRAFDAVKVEDEMKGRFTNIPIGTWDEAELANIASLGFKELSLEAPGSVPETLARESFKNPHIMQSHCLSFVEEAPSEGSDLSEPDWSEFFRARAEEGSRNAFDLLKQGPRQRNDRNVRLLEDGRETDIYGAVLAAIAHVGAESAVQYDAIRTALKEVMASEVPQRQQITNSLDQMTRIAREKIAGEPILEYDNALSTLYIADPFFAYYLRWAPESWKDLSIKRR